MPQTQNKASVALPAPHPQPQHSAFNSSSCWLSKPWGELNLSQPEVSTDTVPRQSDANRPSQEGQISYREHGQERQTKAFQEITCWSPLGQQGGVIAISTDYYRALQSQTKVTVLSAHASTRHCHLFPAHTDTIPTRILLTPSSWEQLELEELFLANSPQGPRLLWEKCSQGKLRH